MDFASPATCSSGPTRRSRTTSTRRASSIRPKCCRLTSRPAPRSAAGRRSCPACASVRARWSAPVRSSLTTYRRWPSCRAIPPASSATRTRPVNRSARRPTPCGPRRRTSRRRPSPASRCTGCCSSGTFEAASPSGTSLRGFRSRRRAISSCSTCRERTSAANTLTAAATSFSSPRADRLPSSPTTDSGARRSCSTRPTSGSTCRR